jgi:regulator of replication initiation timing
MTTEEKTKKNPVYQAIRQTNAPEVKEALDELRRLKAQRETLDEKLKTLAPELISSLEENTILTTKQAAIIKKLIEKHGSYQDIEAGDYALVYERKTAQYDAEAFEARYPNLATAVLVKSVDVKTLEGLIKSGRLNKVDLETGMKDGGNDNIIIEKPVITYKTSQVTVIQ